MKARRVIALVLLLALICAMPAMASQAQVKSLLRVARGKLGAPYSLHSDAPNSFNCLSFVAYCYNQVEGETFSSEGISAKYEKIASMDDLKSGDMVCFKAQKRKKGIQGYHFGIYIGNQCFVHATSGIGVTVSRMKDYKKRFLGGMRIF